MAAATKKSTKIHTHHIGGLPWGEISWRSASVLVCSFLLYSLLSRFHYKGSLSVWDRRWFNILAVLLSALASLCIGSLIGFLGTMIRWPLLAARKHKPFDVSYACTETQFFTIRVSRRWLPEHQADATHSKVFDSLIPLLLPASRLGKWSLSAPHVSPTCAAQPVLARWQHNTIFNPPMRYPLVIYTSGRA
jgi:hypothetical protein